MSVETNKQVVMGFLSGSWNYEKLEALNHYLDPDFHFHGPQGELHGVVAFRDALMAELEAIANLFVHVDDVIGEADQVTARYTTSFEHRGEFMNTYPTGKTITIKGISIHRLANDRIVEFWDIHDRFTMVRQMGGMQRLTVRDEAAIRSVVRDLHGIAFADSEVHADLIYADEAEIMPPNGPTIHGRKKIIEWLERLPPLSEWKVSDLKIDGVGNLAHVSGAYSVLVSPRGREPFRDTGKYLQLWRRQEDGSWKIVRDIFNSDLPIPVREHAKSSAGDPEDRSSGRVGD